ncbi:MAG: hypothetical protein ACOC44_10660 [Promethearchaeia archaeon]
MHEFKREINSNNLSMQELINPIVYILAQAPQEKGDTRGFHAKGDENGEH